MLGVSRLIDIIAFFIDIPISNVKYLTLHKEQIHAGTISKLLYCFASGLIIILLFAKACELTCHTDAETRQYCKFGKKY